MKGKLKLILQRFLKSFLLIDDISEKLQNFQNTI